MCMNIYIIYKIIQICIVLYDIDIIYADVQLNVEKLPGTDYGFATFAARYILIHPFTG
jgi:hypothetical protein